MSTPRRSGPDVKPRVGMVVRYARNESGGDLSSTYHRTITPWPGDAAKDDIVVEFWNRRQYDILSEPVATERCSCAESLALRAALERIVAAIGEATSPIPARGMVDVLTEVNLIAREALR